MNAKQYAMAIYRNAALAAKGQQNSEEYRANEAAMREFEAKKGGKAAKAVSGIVGR